MDARAERSLVGATIADIAAFLDAGTRLRRLSSAEPDLLIDRLAPVADAGPGAMAFLGAAAASVFTAAAHGPSLLILDRRADVDDDVLRGAGVDAVIASDNARLEFVQVAQRLFVAPRTTGIHPSAVIAPSAALEPDITIGPLCTVGERCSIGRGSTLEAGVHLYDGVTVGRNVHIHAGTVIGADGFGYERNDDGVLEKFPHLGAVEIGDDVEIGANACIDRASLGMTRIGRGSKIDNLVHIAHNVRIGERAVVIAHAMVGGSTRVGDGAWVSPSACLRDNIAVGTGATVGLASLVTRDVPDGATVMGNPARDIAEHRALLASWRSQVVSGET